MMDTKMLSMSETDSLVRNAFDRWYYGQLPISDDMMEVSYCWVMEVYADYAIICKGQGLYYQVPYALTSEGVTFAPEENWIKVEKDWTPAKFFETLAYSGGPIKALGEGKVGGYLIRFGGEDLTGEYFTAKTYLGAHEGDGSDCCFHHMIPLKSGLEEYAEHLFAPLKTTRDDMGIFAETVLNMADDYEKMVYELVEKGKLGWSSGTSGHMARRTKSGEITRWPIIEGSFTPTPAEPRNRAIPIKSIPVSSEIGDTLKTLIHHDAAQSPVILPDVKSDTAPAVTLTVTTGKSTSVVITTPETKEDKPMADNDTQTAPVDETGKRLDGLETAVKSVSDSMTKIMEALSKTPKGEGDFYTNTGGDSDPQVKSLGDFCLALYRGDTKRLKSVYKAQRSDDDIKALAEDQGATGGYLVPTEFSAQLVAAQYEISPVINLVRTFPVQAPAGEWPVLDIYTAPTAGSGNTALAGQLVSSVIAEAGTFTDRNVKFRLINWRVSKVGDLVKVSSELMEDAGALEALLRQVMTTALAARKERNIMRGNGVGEPIGILNAPALISYNPATSNVFAWADSVGMRARFKMFGGDRARVRWVYHSSVLPDIAAFQVASGSSATWVANMQADDPTVLSLLTYPLMESEHTPQADNDNSVTLCDFGAYGIWQRGQIDIAFSTDYAFNTDEVTWRFKERYDGRPLIQSSVTSADPTGSYTKSAFIGLNATHV